MQLPAQLVEGNALVGAIEAASLAKDRLRECHRVGVAHWGRLGAPVQKLQR